MTLPAKLGMGALTLGTISGVGYAGSTYLMNKKEEKVISTLQQGTAISNLINSEYKHILLKTEAGDSNTDQEHWRTIWTNYESQKGTGENPLQLKGWSTRNNRNLTEELKEKCKSLISAEVKDINDPTYQKVTTYCARSVTIADEAGKNNLTEVDIGGDKDDQTIWKSRIEKKGELSSELKLLSIEESNIDANKLKEGCKAAKAKKKQEQNYSSIYDAYKKVCTKQKDDPS